MSQTIIFYFIGLVAMCLAISVIAEQGDVNKDEVVNTIQESFSDMGWVGNFAMIFFVEPAMFLGYLIPFHVFWYVVLWLTIGLVFWQYLNPLVALLFAISYLFWRYCLCELKILIKRRFG